MCSGNKLGCSELWEGFASSKANLHGAAMPVLPPKSVRFDARPSTTPVLREPLPARYGFELQSTRKRPFLQQNTFLGPAERTAHRRRASCASVAHSDADGKQEEVEEDEPEQGEQLEHNNNAQHSLGAPLNRHAQPTPTLSAHDRNTPHILSLRIGDFQGSQYC